MSTETNKICKQGGDGNTIIIMLSLLRTIFLTRRESICKMVTFMFLLGFEVIPFSTTRMEHKHLHYRGAAKVSESDILTPRA